MNKRTPLIAIIVVVVLLLFSIAPNEVLDNVKTHPPRQIYTNNQDIDITVKGYVPLKVLGVPIVPLSVSMDTYNMEPSRLTRATTSAYSLFKEEGYSKDEGVFQLIVEKDGQRVTKEVALKKEDIVTPKGVDYVKVSKIELYDQTQMVSGTFFFSKPKVETKTYLKVTFEEDEKQAVLVQKKEKTKKELEEFLESPAK